MSQMTEEEINETLYEFKNECTNIENKHLKDETLLENESFIKNNYDTSFVKKEFGV